MSEKTFSSSPIRILLIEDDVAYSQLIGGILAQEKEPPFSLENITSLSAGLERLARGGVDVVVTDLSLSDSNGIGTFAQVRARSPSVPIVVLTGLAG